MQFPPNRTEAMSHEQTYAGARISLLDRETQTIEEMMLYPITVVHLLGPDAEPARSFRVDDNGAWAEIVQ